MGFRTGAFAKVWEVKPGKGNFSSVRLSISRKSKDTGEYEQDFSGFCMFIGNARAKAAMLKGNERIVLGDTDVSNNYDKTQNKEYINFKVFDFELADGSDSGSGGAKSNSHADHNPVEGDTADDDCPF